ncbi:ribosomal protein L7/L12 [Actinoplanes tereljensis]|uniref:Uncharacterized protein n=1 Tax=Paractinoplanes tereljensis TaxID=571912 RepID=A0A919NQY4_9ACTN|nr:hypothetical protein [Actinoplanes tereljensis]GIF22436.1 hypothetical protein Ate02nite_51660 [Actinoplanes tereljensis]
MTDAEARVKQVRLLAEMARQMVAAGAGADEIARELLRHTDSPIQAIKSLADGTGMGLGDAKWVVHRNLDARVRAAAEELWQGLVDGFALLTGAGEQGCSDQPGCGDA